MCLGKPRELPDVSPAREKVSDWCEPAQSCGDGDFEQASPNGPPMIDIPPPLTVAEDLMRSRPREE